MTHSYQIPDLAKICGDHVELRANQHCRQVGEASACWVDEHAFLNEEERRKLPDLQLSLLASLCFPTCDIPQLRVATDLLTLLFHWQDKPEVMDTAPCQTAFGSIWERLERTTSEAWQARFRASLTAFEDAQRTHANHMKTKRWPQQTAESCLFSKQSADIFSLALSLTEYTEDLTISDGTFRSGPISELRKHAQEFVIWTKDIVAYNVQQSKGDPNNLVAILMTNNKVTLQAAMRLAGDSARKCVRNFVEQEKASAVESMQRDEKRYVQGLKDWMVGLSHWVYETEKYFLDKAEDVKAFGWVFLLPKENEAGE